MEWLTILTVLGLIVIAPIVALVRIVELSRAVRELREQVRRLEADVARQAGPSLVPPAVEAQHLPPPLPFAPPAEPAPAPFTAAPTDATSAPVPPAPTPAAAQAPDVGRLEELIGGIGLQNVGAVLVLFGVFFLILWGYTTGRLGAGVLVVAGVLLGLVLAWRGDRWRRTLPAFGHALVGIGLGIVYLSLYLGHFTLRAIAAGPAFVLLVLTSAAAVAAGLHYGVQTIAVLGVIGAFVPPLLAGWLPLKGFSMTPGALLGYAAVVDGVVLALALRSGWGRVGLAALALTTLTWVVAQPRGHWGWPVTAGLAALFAGFALAPLPWLTRAEGRVRPSHLALIALAPLAFGATAWSMLDDQPRGPVAILFFALALVHTLAALWVDQRRPERDLWRPLTGAATLYLTAALWKATGSDGTPLAWALEGVLLVALGLGAGGAWLRACGYTVSALSALAWLVRLGFTRHDATSWLPPSLLRDLAVVAVLLAGAWWLWRGRGRLSPEERRLPEVWLAAASVMLMTWSALFAANAAAIASGVAGVKPWFETGIGWVDRASPGRPSPEMLARERTLAASFTSLAWFLQGLVTLALGWARRAPYLRWLGLGILGVTLVKFVLVDLATVDVFWRFLVAIGTGAALLAISYAYQRRARGG